MLSGPEEPAIVELYMPIMNGFREGLVDKFGIESKTRVVLFAMPWGVVSPWGPCDPHGTRDMRMLDGERLPTGRRPGTCAALGAIAEAGRGAVELGYRMARIIDPRQRQRILG